MSDNSHNSISPREGRYARERWLQDRDRSLKEFRKYINDNNPPILNDLKAHMKPMLQWGYATLPDLLLIVNAKISPLKVVDIHANKVTFSTSPLQDLRIIDPRDDSLANKESFTQNFHGPVGTVGKNYGSSTGSKPTTSTTKRKFWENHLVLSVIGILGALFVAYLSYEFGWNG